MNLNALLAETGLRAIVAARTILSQEINVVQTAQAQQTRDACVALLTTKPDPATWTAEEHVLFMNHGPMPAPVFRPTTTPSHGAGKPFDASLDAEIPF